MTPQQIEALKLALEALKAMAEDLGYFTEEVPAITALEEGLKEHAMREVQRLGQEIEQEPCVHAKTPKGCYRVRCQLGDKCVDDEMSFRTTPPQPEQEPVAIKCMKEWIEYLKRKSDFGQHMKIPSEMSAGACWELAIELEQFINTAPPQRTWVNLTDEDRNDCLVDADPCECLATPEAQELMRCVEAKSRSKNQ